MISLSIPFWLMGALVGAVCLGLLGAALSIGYKIRKLRSQRGDDQQISTMTTAMLNSHFQHNLLAMQVDAVFNSLSALIETERIKLKAAVAPSIQHFPDEQMQTVETPAVHNIEDTEQNQIPPQPIAVTKQNDPPMDTAKRSDISKAERELTEKMLRYQADDHRKLEAVA